MKITLFLKKFIAIALLSVASLQAWAADLDSAKAQGLIGEKPDGYLGLVVKNAPDDVKAMIKSVNEKRKAKYQEVADQRKIALSKVEVIAGKKALEKTKSGHFIYADGKWIKKP
ncbi:YdbL family protein [Pleionea sediminis]|uniref:YdbL family protein n=1 Tax=Pleionea sediminis TaxID=2569479 RepID=UPI001186A5B7|nr:YdbL family protein [Pleionea sediminis]